MAGSWADLRLYDTDLDDRFRPRFFLLTMYPYPSGGALHIGHWYIKSPTDAIARYKRMHGFNVFLPSGSTSWLPAENTAIKNGVNPRDWTMANIEKMRGQLRSMGATFDVGRRGRHVRPRVLPLEPVDVHPVPREGPGLPRGLAGGLVPQRRHARPRAGRGHGPPLLALRGAGREARAGRSGISASPSTRTSCSTSPASTGPSRSRRCRPTGSAARPGAEVGLHGRRHAAPPGRRGDRACSPPGRTRCSARRSWCSRPSMSWCRSLTAPDARRPRSTHTCAGRCRKTEIDRLSTDREKTGVVHRRGRHQPGQRRAHPDLRSPTTSWAATAPARSWRCPATTSATSPSPGSSACRSSRSSCPRTATRTRSWSRRSWRTPSTRSMVNSGRVRRPPRVRGLARQCQVARGRWGGAHRRSRTASVTG